MRGGDLRHGEVRSALGSRQTFTCRKRGIPMRPQPGFFTRLWIVVSGLWWIVILWGISIDPAFRRSEAMVIISAFIPPTLLYAAGLTLRWVWRGRKVGQAVMLIFVGLFGIASADAATAANAPNPS